MNRNDAVALGLSAIGLGAVAATHRPRIPIEATRRPATSVARHAIVVRAGVPVRQGPSPAAPVLGTLSEGDQIVVDPTETSFPGVLPLVRETIDEQGIRFERILGWVRTSDVRVENGTPVASRTGELVNQTAVGTIGGRHTLAETRDLLAVADYRFREVAAALQESRLRPTDSATRADLDADWARLSASWATARQQVAKNLILKGAAFPIFLPDDMIPTEDEWVRVLSFVQGQELMRGSLQDITRRVERILGRQVLFENQPAQGSADVDLALFQTLDAEIRAGEVAAERVAASAKRAAFSPTGLALGGTLLTIGGVVLTVAFLPEIRLALGAARAVRGR